MLTYGVFSIVYEATKDDDASWVHDVNSRYANILIVLWSIIEHLRSSMSWAIEKAKELGSLKAGDSVVCVHGLGKLLNGVLVLF